MSNRKEVDISEAHSTCTENDFLCWRQKVIWNIYKGEKSRFQESKYLTVIVATKDDSRGVRVMLKYKTHLIKLKEHYCDFVGFPVSAFKFLYRGRLIRDDETPTQLQMRDGDLIEVVCLLQLVETSRPSHPSKK